MKQIEVVAAVLVRQGKFLATQRGYGEFRGYWEFPGGKIEVGESREEALQREIREELETEICVGEHLITVDYDYPSFHLTMHCFLCSLLSDAMVLKEHGGALWLSPDELHTVTWLPAARISFSRLFPVRRSSL